MLKLVRRQVVQDFVRHVTNIDHSTSATKGPFKQDSDAICFTLQKTYFGSRIGCVLEGTKVGKGSRLVVFQHAEEEIITTLTAW